MSPAAARLEANDTSISSPNLPLMLLQAREKVIARFKPILHAHGLTEQQWRILRVLAAQGAMEQREIGAACGFASASLVGILDRMQTLQLVERARLNHDQRRVQVSLTPKSQTLVRAMAPKIDAVYAQLQRDVGADLSARFYRDLALFMRRT